MILAPGATPLPPGLLPRLTSLDCAVLAFLSEEAHAATLREHLAHNDSVTLLRRPTDGQSLPTLSEADVAVLGQWLREVAA